jgi:hypothetical protein
MKKVNFRHIEFLVDYDYNKSNYEMINPVGASSCSCSGCQNYLAQNQYIFPEELLSFFEEVGIDYLKDFETTFSHKSDEGKYEYFSTFYFNGVVLNSFAQNVQKISKLTNISVNDNFRIHFEHDTQNRDWRSDNLMYVLVSSTLPWVIDPALDDY